MAGSVPKVCLITGSSAGLGAAIARAMAPDFRIVINYANNKGRADQLVEELSSVSSTFSDILSPSPRFIAIQADAASKSEVVSLVEQSVRAMGRLDVVISNAGWTRLTNFMNLDENVVEEDWDKCFNLNVKTHLWLMHAVQKHLEETEGCFISTASAAGVKPGGSSLAYAVTKAAQIHLAKSLAYICSPKIRVNSISPGMLLTEWGMKFPETKRQAAINKTKLQRLATVEDVALQVRTLALSQSATGQNICIDSGSTI